ncbi:MAG: DUF1254 domain-containing protein, partial [Flavobacteriaceae bacterium]|nr:DUF1254 domain-containing protein [Flavobacteriaceae bacterium]
MKRKTKILKSIPYVILISVLFTISACSNANQKKKTEEITTEQVKNIAKDAYIFAYPTLEVYKTMYVQAINKKNPAYKGEINQFHHMTKLLDADFTAITAPNNDTYYSFLWMDLSTEPLVVTIPAIPKDRYYVLQMEDINGFNFDYIGSRATGNKGGTYLIAGPLWKGETPKGIDKVFRSETQFNLMLGRILVRGEEDHENVMKILRQYKVQPLSAFEGKEAPKAIKIDFLAYDEKKATSADFISYFNFMLDYQDIHPDDQKYFDEFVKIGIAKGNVFNKSKIKPEILKAIEEGVKEGHAAILERKKTTGKMVNNWSFIGEAFGSREVMQDQNLLKAAGAATGLFGNDKEEASNFSGTLDAEKKPLNCSNNAKYTIRFEKGQTPPVNAFWSITMYKLP